MVGVVYVVGILPLMESLNLLCVDMNAKEFAHELEKAASFIRQQQAEIEALKLQLHTTLTNRNLRTYDGKAQK